MDTLPQRSAGALLVSGALVFWLGAFTPPYRQWMGVPVQEYLQIVGEHRPNWLFIHGCFALGALLTVAGFAALAQLSTPLRVASSLFSTATVLWLVSIAFRVSVTLRAAEELARTNVVSSAYLGASDWAGVLFGAYMAISYTSIAVLGAALRGADLVPRWIANFATVFGALALPGLATPAFQPPLMVYVAPFLVGAALVRRRRTSAS
jgi:hypothetical protein